MSGGVRGADRYTRSRPCPICGGDPTRPSGKGERCFGYRSTDANNRPWAFCTREELAGGATFSAGANGYAHALEGACKCGVTHGGFGPRERVYDPRSAPQGHQKPEQPRLDLDTLHAVHSAYLGLLKLRREHAAYYAARGAADLAAARAHGYGSLPLGYESARRITDTLVARFGISTMQAVPGFYTGKDGRLLTHTARKGDDAAVIPCRDEQGRITMLVRQQTDGQQAKYRAFSGSHAGEAYAVCGEWASGMERQVAIIEGPHKAHVAAQLSTGIVFIGLMGTNLSDAHLAAIERLKPDIVFEALDGDKETNVNVAKARARMHEKLLGSEKLARAGVQIMTVVWPADDGKGLDDLLAAGHMPMLRTVPRRPAVSARKPHAIPQPGRVAAGKPLAEVQAETEHVIGEFVRQRRTKHGRVKMVRVQPGVGKSTAVAQAIKKHGSAARILVSTKEKAAEVESAAPWIRAVDGRNSQNCQSFDVAEAARKKHHDVQQVVCQQCPALTTCRTSGYYSQFEQPGPLVGTVEMLYSGSFMRNGDLTVLDDPGLDRAMIETRKVPAATALQLACVVSPGVDRELMLVVQRAIDTRREIAEYAPPLIGPPAWDALARAAGGAGRLIELVRATSNAQDILPSPADHGPLTVEDIERAPDAVLGRLVELLKSEVDDFARRREFNSGLSIHPGALEIRTARPMLVDEKTGRSLLQDKALLILDATPIMPLYDQLAAGLVMEPVYAPEVALPPNVAVTQVADAFYGKTMVERQEGEHHRRTGRENLLASMDAWRQVYPGDREAAICAKSLRDDVVAAGIAEDRVLTFYGQRGLNTIEDADVLHVLGRPQAPDYSALLMANVLHRGEAPISPHMVMREEAYAGYRAADGAGRAITVLDFDDPRASVLFRAYREAELVQAVHRARLFRVGSAQVDMFETTGQVIARKASDRRRVRLVIHSAHPVPGLRVDELVYGEEPGTNERRAVEAAERIIAACRQLVSQGIPLTVNAVARVTGSNKRTVAKVLADEKFDPARFTPLIDITTTRGVNRAPSNSSLASDFKPPGVLPDTVPRSDLPPAAGAELQATGVGFHAVTAASPFHPDRGP
ncbi:MAG: hypothetical protein AB7P12_15755 [Alphaproteobacteria bacterium]